MDGLKRIRHNPNKKRENRKMIATKPQRNGKYGNISLSISAERLPRRTKIKLEDSRRRNSRPMEI
jgi:hypothetical protein